MNWVSWWAISCVHTNESVDAVSGQFISVDTQAVVFVGIRITRLNKCGVAINHHGGFHAEEVVGLCDRRVDYVVGQSIFMGGCQK